MSDRYHWKQYALRVDLWLFVASTVVFLGFPNIDLRISSYFYDGQGFPGARNAVFHAIYLIFAYIHLFYLVALLGCIVYFTRKARYAARKSTVFLLLVLILGPGLLVNGILKNYSIGRARPVQVQQFGGSDHFTPAFVYSGACEKNCSFVSGHAAIAFYAMSLAWVFSSRALLAPGIALGLIVGVVRIAQGGHFASDVIFAGWAVYLVCVLCAHALKIRPLGKVYVHSTG